MIKLSCFRDLLAYRIVISLPKCHLQEGQDREEEEIKLLYEIANKLPSWSPRSSRRIDAQRFQNGLI